MSPLTPLLLRGLAGPARRLLVPRAHLHAKPAREQLGTLVSSGLCGAHAAVRVWAGLRAQGTRLGPRRAVGPRIPVTACGSVPGCLTAVSEDSGCYRC